MTAKSTWPGTWWFPEDEDDKRHGVLTRADDGQLRLHLTEGYSTFVPSQDTAGWEVEGDGRFFVMFGEVDDRPITLLDCWATKQYRPDHPLLRKEHQELIVRTALLGTHQVPGGQASVSAVTFEVENLTAFLQPWPSDATDSTASDRERSVRAFTASAELEHDGLQIQVGLQTETRHTSSTRGSQSFGTYTRAQVRLTAPAPRPFADFDRLSKPFIDFVTLVADQKSALIRYTGIDSDDGEFDVIEQLVAPPDPAGEPQNGYRFLFRVADVDLPLVVTNWLTLWFKTNPAISLMLANKYQSSFIEFHALALAVAVESLHKKLRPDAKVRGEPDFGTAKGRILAAIRTAIDQEHCEDNDLTWVNSALGDDLSFQKRARGLVELADRDKRIRVLSDVNEWVKNLKASRNGLAHGGSAKAEDPLRLLIEQTKWLLAIVLLQQIGVPAEKQIPEEGALQYLETLTARVARSSRS